MGDKNASNRPEQLNPNHPDYWKSRGHSDRPADWADRSKTEPRKDENGTKSGGRK